MKFFKDGKLTAWQGAILKISMVSLGVALATTWPEVFSGYQALAWILGIAGGLYIKWVWYKR